tara:strand:- start:17 stop:502 length:486 start_codon:yes stop_codon:yes gene_type:complete
MDFLDRRANYAERYVFPDDIDERRARGRRWRALIEATGFVENLEDEPPKHCVLRAALKNSRAPMDHTTYLDLGNMAVVMTEPYWRTSLDDFDPERFAAIEVPANIAPYCGFWNPAPGATPLTKTYLIASITKKRQLEVVGVRLEEAAKDMPAWNYMGEDSA